MAHPHKENNVQCSNCRQRYCAVCRSSCPACHSVHVVNDPNPAIPATPAPLLPSPYFRPGYRRQTTWHGAPALTSGAGAHPSKVFH